MGLQTDFFSSSFFPPPNFLFLLGTENAVGGHGSLAVYAILFSCKAMENIFEDKSKLKPELVPSFPSLSHVFYISKIQDGQKKKKTVQGVGGRWRGPLIKKMGVKKYIYIFSSFLLCARGRGGSGGWGYRVPIKKNGGKKIFSAIQVAA